MNNNEPAPQPFTDQNNAVYNGLRDTVMRFVAQGVPGMDKLADSLNKTHLEQMKNYVAPKPAPVAATQPIPASPAPVRQAQPVQPSNPAPRPVMPAPSQPATPQTAPQAPIQPSGDPVQNLHSMMDGILKQNAPTLPNGYSSYA